MTASSGTPFRLDERALQASALRAQVLERCRRTLHHDMNNAVQSIHSGLELLAKCIDSPGIARISPQECIALLQQQFVTLRQTLTRLVDDITDPPGDPERFDLSALTSDALQLLRHERAASKASTDIAPDVSVHARKVNVRTAVLALLLDAIDHLPSDRVLDVSVVRQGEQAVLEIKGARQSMSAAETAASPLVRMLAQMLANEAAELAVRQVDERISTAIHLPSPADGMSAHAAKAAALRVLIADRNRDAADSLAMILQLEGMQAQTLYSGDRLPKVLATFAPDIALIDIELGCDVQELARAAQAAQRPGARRPLLAQVSSTEGARHEAFDAHLLRPVEWPQLQALIARARSRIR